MTKCDTQLKYRPGADAPNRYILQEDYTGHPFISIETAQHNITFSCVAYLNTSLFLLPEYSTDQQRAALVLQGLHGLQPYSNRFWIDHLLQHCAFQARQGQQVSDHLYGQLNLLLRFCKDLADQASLPESNHNSTKLEGIKALEQLPQVRDLVLRLIGFRSRMEDKYASSSPDQTPQSTYIYLSLTTSINMHFLDMCLDSYSSDPTFFSLVHYQYQMTLEWLLSHEARQAVLNIDARKLKSFVDLYGVSAFVCRYSHCAKATDGFSSARQRDLHEANHQRKFRCAYRSCVNFASGFATRGALNKHNDKYHRSVEQQLEQPSLSDHIRHGRSPKALSPANPTTLSDQVSPMSRQNSLYDEPVVESFPMVRENVSKAPPTPEVPEGYKAIWHEDYKEFYYANIYTKQSQWEKPPDPVYSPGISPPGPFVNTLAGAVPEMQSWPNSNGGVAATGNETQEINDTIQSDVTTNQQQSSQILDTQQSFQQHPPEVINPIIASQIRHQASIFYRERLPALQSAHPSGLSVEADRALRAQCLADAQTTVLRLRRALMAQQLGNNNILEIKNKR